MSPSSICCENSIYQYNPLLKAIHTYNDLIKNTFSPLPEKGPVAECAVRIILAVVSPFAYVILGLTYLAGLILNPIWKNRHFQDLEKLKPNSLDFPNLDESQLNKIWDTRCRLFSLTKELGDLNYNNYWLDSRINAMLSKPEMLDQLNIQLSIDEIEEIFEKHKIIVLRKPQENNLTFYCGNNPIYSSAMNRDYDPKNNTHSHDGEDTIDCDLLMNPTIVAKIGDLGLKAYFETIGHKYQLISGCNMTVIHETFDRNNQIEVLKVLRAPNGKIIDTCHNKNSLVEI